MTIYKIADCRWNMLSRAVSIVACLCTLIGLGATAAYVVTLYLLPWNQLFVDGKSSHDERDVPYLLAIIECALSAATFIMGVVAFYFGPPKKCVAFVVLLFFVVLSMVEGTIGAVRVWNLGYLGDDMVKTCSDRGRSSGCPTTRFEHSPNHEIVYTEPQGGDCRFWFWGSMETQNEMKSTQELLAANPDHKYDMEDYMDWSKYQSYGWREDPRQLRRGFTNASAFASGTRIHNMQRLLSLQNFYYKGATQPILAKSNLFTEQPSIAYCWYWGCSAVCNSLRWTVNQWWLVSSLSLFVLYGINILLTAWIYRNTKDHKDHDDKDAGVDTSTSLLDYSDEESLIIAAPVIGRRRRTLTGNPSVLRF